MSYEMWNDCTSWREDENSAIENCFVFNGSVKQVPEYAMNYSCLPNCDMTDLAEYQEIHNTPETKQKEAQTQMKFRTYVKEPYSCVKWCSRIHSGQFIWIYY